MQQFRIYGTPQTKNGIKPVPVLLVPLITNDPRVVWRSAGIPIDGVHRIRLARRLSRHDGNAEAPRYRYQRAHYRALCVELLCFCFLQFCQSRMKHFKNFDSIHDECGNSHVFWCLPRRSQSLKVTVVVLQSLDVLSKTQFCSKM